MPYLSYSQLASLHGCSLAYKYERIDRLPKGPEPFHFAMGSAAHKGIEVALQRHIDTGRLAPSRDVIAAVEADFDARVAATPDMDWTERRGRYQVPPEEARRWAVEMALAMHETVLPRVIPVAVEEKFTVAVPGRPGWQYTGYIDCVGYERGKRAQGLKVWDWKSGSAYTQAKADQVGVTVKQLPSYAWAKAQQGVKVKYGYYGAVTRPRYGKPAEAALWESHWTPADVAEFERLLLAGVDLREAGGPYEANLEYQWCGDYCAFSTICPALAARRAQEALPLKVVGLKL